ncbi:hypothetical protein I601_3801 [Nocardioides dokdonensis FR1436]|uniref:DUF222 domain-containing protein n=1 Tax=Nocardioides dokdonensis FR1436 TaxID=1300347 RepID=A0A1A9GRE0_9ACTN|nr:hypothetical protein I601_3801 [Nocardioides dokdonensis FR1436]
MAGRVPVWRSSRVAEATLGLPLDGAAFVDQHLAPVAATLSYAGIDRLVEEARARFDPEEAEERLLIAAETRNLAIHLASATAGGQQVDGTVDITGCLDLADALDLTGDDSAARVPARQVVLNVHLTDQALRGVDPTTTGAGIHLARIEETRSLITLDQVTEWLRVPGTQVAWRTVTDLPSSVRGGIDAEAFEHPFRTQPTAPDHARRHHRSPAKTSTGSPTTPDSRPSNAGPSTSRRPRRSTPTRSPNASPSRPANATRAAASRTAPDGRDAASRTRPTPPGTTGPPPPGSSGPARTATSTSSNPSPPPTSAKHPAPAPHHRPDHPGPPSGRPASRPARQR